MLARRDLPAWASPKILCRESPSDLVYLKIGGHGIPINHPDVSKLKAARNAVEKARSAYENQLSPSNAWSDTAEAFQNLPQLPSSWESDAQEPVVNQQVSLPYVLRKSNEIATACRIAALYHDPSTHVRKPDMMNMAKMAQSVSTEHVVCPQRICSRLAQMEFEENVQAAAAIEKTAETGTFDEHETAAEIALKYQQYAARGQLNFSAILPEMINSDHKDAMAALTLRVQKSYPDTYPAVLKAEEEKFSPVTIK